MWSTTNCVFLAYAARAMPDTSYVAVSQLQELRLPRASPPSLQGLRGKEGGTPTPRLRSRTLGAAFLVAAILTLAALAGPHLVEHLLGVGGDPDHCAVCAAVHGMRAGLSAAAADSVAALPLAGLPSLQHPLSAPAVTIPAPSSRAPPLAG
jgi:hypothetical protein